LITSLGSDAYNDVLRTFEESGFAFRVTAHGARVQGPATEPSVLNALDRLRAMADRLDIVLICRGGGSRTDLAWFDSEALGRAVATFPVPIIVGIGHEQDVSVLDHVARRAKTPTAAAAMVVERVAAALERVESIGSAVLERSSGVLREARVAAAERGRRLARAARHRLDRGRFELNARQARTVRAARGKIREATGALGRAARSLPRAAQVRLAAAAEGLERSVRQLIQGARRDASQAGRRISTAVGRLGPVSRRAVGREQERAGARERRLHLLDPRRVIERGYAILRGPEGVVRRTDQAPEGTPLTAELRDGRLRIRSEGPETGRENDA
jgi:exodeoxyribonuclease VII large subunit